jgi:hypothetical protein
LRPFSGGDFVASEHVIGVLLFGLGQFGQLFDDAFESFGDIDL